MQKSQIFDCSAEYDGFSVNKRLLSGPDLTWQSLQILKTCFIKCSQKIDI